MPLLQPRPAPNDGGYAVQDYRAVRPDLGTWTTCGTWPARCTSAASACASTWCSTTSPASTSGRGGRGPATQRYRDYFHVFPDRDDAGRLRARPCPRCSRTSRRAASPGTTSSTAGCGRRSTRYQWDLNWANPDVLCEFADDHLLPGQPGRRGASGWTRSRSLWKRLGTNCQNQPEVHALTQALRAVARIACPGGGVQGRGDRRAARTCVAYLGVGDRTPARSATSPTTTG